MSVHQIIYTSCMRGINGVNDGQQVYSYDEAFKDANNDGIKRLFTYQHPTLQAGTIMSEDIARTMPKSFIYRRLENGSCALALNTYLGRDYMGSTGRFGNHLSHVIAFEAEDTALYPAEYYGSSFLRDHMDFSEVNNPNKPDYLPEPVLERGPAVDIDAVIEFLNISDRMETFKNMLHAMLAFESERKRVVICDEPGNIILWIAALEFALPLKNALNVNFSTYDYDPALSTSQICGVVPYGTRYDADSHYVHYVFDLLENRSAELDNSDDFYGFIDIAFSFSYESLKDFHYFLCSGFQYENANERIYSAYTLYSLLSDGIGEISSEKLDNALSFADDFAVAAENDSIVRWLLNEREVLLRSDSEIFLRAISYIVKHITDSDEAVIGSTKELIVDRILCEFLDANVAEATFAKLYQQINACCTQQGFGVASELMREQNRTKLISVLRRNIAAWKPLFIVRVISDYVKDQKMTAFQLPLGAEIGQIYYGIVHAVYESGRENGSVVVTKILETFSDNCTYLVNMGLSLEGMLLELPNGAAEVSAMWKCFGKTMLSSQRENFNKAYVILGEYHRYDLVYSLYDLAIYEVMDPEECRAFFEEHCRSFAQKEKEYFSQYYTIVLASYYKSLCRFDDTSTYSAKTELFSLIVSQRIDVDFAEDLIKALVKPIPYKSPTKDEAALIRSVFNYNNNFRHRPVTGKLLLLIIGMVLEYASGKQKQHDKLALLKKLTMGTKTDLSGLGEKNIRNYFDWMIPSICELCDQTEDIFDVYKFFVMSTEAEALFFAQCARIYLRRSSSENDYAVFCEFLGAVFGCPSLRSHKEVGKVLSKLNKKKLGALDEIVTEHFRGDAQALRFWNEIRNTADSTNPFAASFSGLINRFRSDQEE